MAPKLRKSRPAQGAHLAALRQRAGLTQAELGHLVGQKQQIIAFSEQTDKPPRSDGCLSASRSSVLASKRCSRRPLLLLPCSPGAADPSAKSESYSAIRRGLQA